ncbi:universal stress protein [Kitasatospora kazusensis]|uniref:Universal stress protein n=1 Tax=Kitasatospora kazusensis TaxID=407974 RepID=A0ABN2ZKE8_9ACTN
MRYRVVVGIDGTDASHDAVDWAADEARQRRGSLHLLHAWFGEMAQAFTGRATHLSRDAGEEALGAAAEQARLRHPDLAVTTELVDGHARDAVLAAAGEAELLVLGARGSGGFPRLLVGSTSLDAAARAACPVVVVHPAADRASAGGVLAGVHGRDPEQPVLDFAFEAAVRRELPLLAVHAWSYPLVAGAGRALPPVFEEGHIKAEQDRLLAEVLAGYRQEYPGVKVETLSVRSGAARELVALSAAHQLVVVGRHGTARGPLGRLGSVSQAVVQHGQCPVAVVPAG